MQLYLVEKNDKTISVGIKEMNSTMITPLLNKLSENKDVSLVRYIEKHPELVDPVLVVGVSKGKPEDAIKKAAQAISEYYSGMKIN
jgi:DNA-directed RNA polymerase, subunit L